MKQAIGVERGLAMHGTGLRRQEDVSFDLLDPDYVLRLNVIWPRLHQGGRHRHIAPCRDRVLHEGSLKLRDLGRPSLAMPTGVLLELTMGEAASTALDQELPEEAHVS